MTRKIRAGSDLRHDVRYIYRNIYRNKENSQQTRLCGARSGSPQLCATLASFPGTWAGNEDNATSAPMGYSCRISALYHHVIFRPGWLTYSLNTFHSNCRHDAVQNRVYIFTQVFILSRSAQLGVRELILHFHNCQHADHVATQSFT